MSRHKNSVTTNLSFFATPEKCHDINFFVEKIIFTFSSSTLSQHSLICCDIHCGVLLKLYCDKIFFCHDRVSLSCMLILSRQTFSFS